MRTKKTDPESGDVLINAVLDHIDGFFAELEKTLAEDFAVHEEEEREKKNETV